MGRSEQARGLLLVADHEHPNYHQSSDGGVDCNSSATAFLLFSAVVAATCSFTSGYCLGYSSPAEYGVLADLSLSMAEYSVFGSMLAVGGMIGALMSGETADYSGRRTTMWIINVFFILGWLAIAFTKVSWLLDLGRLLQGIGIALTSYVGNIFIAEITPKNLRGGLMTLNSWMTVSGVAMVYLIGSVVKWRGLALIGCIPCLLQILCLFFIPESPRWLLKNGREKEFEGVLQRLRGKKADISPEAAEIKEYAEFIQRLSEIYFLDLFQKKYARPITVGYSSPAESGIMEDLGLSVAAYSVFGSIVTIGGMVGAILSGKMADLVGRRGTMWTCQIICMAGWLAIAFAKKAWCLDIGRFLVGVAIGILTYVVPVYISEITPKNLRGRFTSANQIVDNLTARC